MKKTHFCATIVACFIVVSAVASLSAQRPAAGPANGIAVIDMQFIFKKWEGFKARGEQVRKDLDAIMADLNKEKTEIQRLVERSKDLKPGAADYKKAEEQLATMQAKLNVDTAMAKKRGQELQAKNMYEVLREVNAVVREISVHEGIGLVLQFSSEPMDENNPETVGAKLGSIVMYQDRKDITDLVLEELNRRGHSTAARPAAPGAPRAQ